MEGLGFSLALLELPDARILGGQDAILKPGSWMLKTDLGKQVGPYSVCSEIRFGGTPKTGPQGGYHVPDKGRNV